MTLQYSMVKIVMQVMRRPVPSKREITHDVGGGRGFLSRNLTVPKANRWRTPEMYEISGSLTEVEILTIFELGRA